MHLLRMKMIDQAKHNHNPRTYHTFGENLMGFRGVGFGTYLRISQTAVYFLRISLTAGTVKMGFSRRSAWGVALGAAFLTYAVYAASFSLPAKVS